MHYNKEGERGDFKSFLLLAVGLGISGVLGTLIASGMASWKGLAGEAVYEYISGGVYLLIIAGLVIGVIVGLVRRALRPRQSQSQDRELLVKST